MDSFNADKVNTFPQALRKRWDRAVERGNSAVIEAAKLMVELQPLVAHSESAVEANTIWETCQAHVFVLPGSLAETEIKMRMAALHDKCQTLGRLVIPAETSFSQTDVYSQLCTL